MADASRNGVAQEAVQNMKRASKTMTDAEARQILGVTENASWEEIMQVSLVQWYLVVDAAIRVRVTSILLLSAEIW